jgi:transglutaminase-like putative cysteine protease
MKKFILSLIVLFSLFGCVDSSTLPVPDPETIQREIEKGNFTEASGMIGLYLASDTLSPEYRYYWNFRRDVMNRIKRDFNRSEEEVKEYIKEFYPNLEQKQLEEWERSNALENMTIDGEKRYFHSAARNLFRIDSSAAERFTSSGHGQSDSLDRFLHWFIPSLVKEREGTGKDLIEPKKFRVKYTLTIKPGEVPEGETIRAWMPYPRSDVSSQTEIRLISASCPDYIISPDNFAHKSIYMEAPSKGDHPTLFEYEFGYTSYARTPQISADDIPAYDTSSNLYKEHTSQRAPHIVFSKRITSITDSLTHNIDNPYLKTRAIYEWINSNFPWASAREYSTIDNIPEYVLDNRHGDCGQVSLLFITMARAAGIPAKWQSGWMLHPGNKNLHDWAEVYFEGIGWVPVDQSFGTTGLKEENEEAYYFFTNGLDQYRLVVNQDISRSFYPAKIHPRSETVDFQRGEVEWRGENLYFGRWSYNMDIEYLN